MGSRSQPKEKLAAGIAKNIPFSPKNSSKTLKALTSEKEANHRAQYFCLLTWQIYSLGHQLSYMSKYAHSVALLHPYTTATLAQHCIDQIFRFHGALVEIISDRDPVSVSNFWKEFFDHSVFLISFNPFYSVFPSFLLSISFSFPPKPYITYSHYALKMEKHSTTH